jgi:hypothetical protein
MDPKSVASSNYATGSVNKIVRVGLGDPGSRPESDRIDINKAYVVGQDLVNMLDVTKNESNASFGGNKRDLVKFAFETIQNTTEQSVRTTHFRAFLTGYSDSHSAEWSAKRYSGRGENFYTYQGFDRTVSFNFRIAAQSKQEMRPLYRKLNYLLSTLAPDYSSAGAMRGNITRLTLGELFNKQPGVLTSLNLTVDDNYPWEIAFEEGGTGGLVNESDIMIELPQIIDAAVTFKPILTDLPQTGFNTVAGNNKQTPILIASQDEKAKIFLNKVDVAE